MRSDSVFRLWAWIVSKEGHYLGRQAGRNPRVVALPVADRHDRDAKLRCHLLLHELAVHADLLEMLAECLGLLVIPPGRWNPAPQ